MSTSKINQIHSELDRIESQNITLEKLIRSTKVDVFDSINFTGYQREINEKHVLKIVKYITDEFRQGNFLFPSPIICSRRDGDSNLFIVDGQHRVSAFKNIQDNKPELFEMIKDFELNIIVLENPTIKLEVDTFITINKTSKKVDTSLALIAKTLHSSLDSSDQTAKKQFILVETARKMDTTDGSHFLNNIAWEGTPQSTGKTISLNTFVRAYMPIVNYLVKHNLIDLSENSDLVKYINLCFNIINSIWDSFEKKWPQLFNEGKNSIVQGTIGSSAIIKFLINYLNKDESRGTVDDKILIKEIKTAIERINDNYENWVPNGTYSNYSSGAGHTIISKILMDSIDK